MVIVTLSECKFFAQLLQKRFCPSINLNLKNMLQMWQCYFKSILLDISVFSFTVPHEFHDILHRYTIQGYRVIALAHKKMDPKLTWHQAQRISR